MVAQRSREGAHVYTYTSERVGKKTAHGTIVICPVCGRRGARRDYPGKQGDRVVAGITHAYSIEYGFRTSTSDQHCIIKSEG